ncbi:acyltransferase [bacterium (Candidatus Blackallbacteria) CG17_big_fil_post_rev_8_21_14_2_50_48_46]|uniref:Acyltransferase n=1 Tax=bacterium (Candidatus Blackallbacteria) CG17_big_fil_post_rev_8_21_14_2_50_48_46 TaxID=2014261 RepID=A0A2M7FZ84_9BACT|nr:MAG: acyltransferase [bacterium (Candidatus Blackallbacteria) CG18_big_fil_WC_8_21_14_2_50_49_26]PIW14713.1 MAG: acyltransferase [bacterium (Candidatus Blackallbacteria) CG17_big_fil_post_rev_8_21_14_2_50_48_46]PIW50815.1 MAG: acyltransferase [bacterium (Candidatus Blackallbacteria) CG13_big_fil_rev_8_21_14_2_50_49_14]
MFSFLPSPLLGVLSASMIVLNTLFWCATLVPLILLKFIPIQPLRHFSTLGLMWLANHWVAGNSLIMKLTQDTDWDVSGIEQLDLRKSYLVISNHRSWTDIFVLQHVFQGKIPFLKFFLKQQLIWVPLLGVAWWALDFPFMKRYSREYLEKHPEMRGKDMETTRKHCEKYKQYPVSVINFLEGTRLTEAKLKRQNSPYQQLLKPKAGGVALVLSAMGDTLSEVLDVTILYPGHQKHKPFWALLSGHLPEITVKVRTLPLPENVIGRDYLNDPDYQQQIQTWVNQLWQDKDQLIQATQAAWQSQHPDTRQPAPQLEKV